MFNRCLFYLIFILLSFANLSQAANESLFSSQNASHFDLQKKLAAPLISTIKSYAHENLETSKFTGWKKILSSIPQIADPKLNLTTWELRLDPSDCFNSSINKRLEILSSRNHPPTVS